MFNILLRNYYLGFKLFHGVPSYVTFEKIKKLLHSLAETILQPKTVNRCFPIKSVLGWFKKEPMLLR